MFPSDLQLELEYWAETGEYDEDELHEVRHLEIGKIGIFLASSIYHDDFSLLLAMRSIMCFFPKEFKRDLLCTVYREFLKPDNTRLQVFFNGFKISDIHQLILALMF